MKQQEQQTKFKFINQKPKIYKYEQPKTQCDLVFTNWNNTEYEIVESEIVDLGVNKSYKDYIREGFNPNISNQSPVYGVAKKLQPKSKTIQEMRDNIDKANATLKESLQKQQEQPQQEQPQQEQPQGDK